jgi:hypothetical protein
VDTTSNPMLVHIDDQNMSLFRGLCTTGDNLDVLWIPSQCIKCWCISHSMGPVRIRLFEEEWGVICPITVVSLAGQ